MMGARFLFLQSSEKERTIPGTTCQSVTLHSLGKPWNTSSWEPFLVTEGQDDD